LTKYAPSIPNPYRSPTPPSKTNCSQLATQLYASLSYLSTHHPSQPLDPNARPSTNQQQPSEGNPSDPPPPDHEDSPDLFARRQRELARDLILKEQQIEYLIGKLPGLGSSEVEQEARIKELEGELREMGAERERVRGELKGMVRRVEGVVMGAGRGG